MVKRVVVVVVVGGVECGGGGDGRVGASVVMKAMEE